MANAFIKKGADIFVCWEESDCIGPDAGGFLFQSLLSGNTFNETLAFLRENDRLVEPIHYKEGKEYHKETHLRYKFNEKKGITGSYRIFDRTISGSSNLTFNDEYKNQSQIKSFILTNTGEASLEVTSIEFPHTAYKATKWSNGWIDAGATQSVEVTFTPLLVGGYNGDIKVYSNASNGTQTIPIRGRCIETPKKEPSLSFEPYETCAFGNVNLNTSVSKTIKISNLGDADLKITSIAPSSGYNVNWTTKTIATGKSENLIITFTPDKAISYDGYITITSNASNGDHIGIPVTGKGVETSVPKPTVSITYAAPTSQTTATATGSVTANGASITERGICYSSTTTSPTVSHNKSTATGSSNQFTCTLTTGISAGGTYHVRAYARTSDGNYYYSSSYMTFTTPKNVATPTVSIISAASTGPTTATATGSVTANGATISVRGICYSSETSSPTVSHNKSTATENSNQFTCALTTGLSVGRTYYARAYVQTSDGNYYYSSGNATFTTQARLPDNPSSPIPKDGQTGISTSTTLNWSSSGAVSHDLYIGTSRDGMNRYTDGQKTATTHTVSLSAGTQYYWKVVAYGDNTQGVHSDVWSFKTQEAAVTQPQVSLSGSMTFGSVTVGSSATRTLTVKNTGNARLDVSRISCPPGYNCIYSNSGFSLEATKSLDVTITFLPTATYPPYNGTIQVLSNAPDSPHSITVTGTGTQAAAPAVSLSGSLAFDSVAIGSTATRTLTIRNTGTAPLTVNSINCPTGYSVNWTGGSIEAGGTRDVTVTFKPTSLTLYNGSISVSSNASGSPHSVAVSGTGTPAAAPGVSLSGSLTFGSVTIGNTATRTLTVRNTGTAPLTVNSINCPTGYSVNWTGGSIADGGTRDVTVTFKPTSATSYNGSISVSSNASGSPHSATVSGTGAQAAAPGVSLSGSLAFGSVNIGSTATRTLTIKNTGTALLNINLINCPTGYSANWAGGSIAAGGTKDVTITFSPTSATSYNGSIYVASDASGSPHTIAISGTGNQAAAPGVSLSGSLNFGSVNIGNSATRTLTIKNTGTALLNINLINCPTGYSANWAGGTIEAGGTKDVTITFNPTSVTSYNGSIYVASDASGSPHTIAISGTGAQPAIPSISLSGPLNFGNVNIGSSTHNTLTITNTGTGTLTVNSISCPFAYSANWSGGTIEAGRSQSVLITFSPTTLTSYNGNISVSSNASNGTQYISVSGSGTYAVPTFTPASGTYTSCSSGSSVCGSETYTAGTISATVQSYDSSTRTITFRVKKCDNGLFSSSGYLYVVGASLCISYDIGYINRKSVSTGVSYIDITAPLSSTSGTSIFTLVYRPTNQISGRYYTTPITARF
ncbi:MAG: choice-of-anchor D domain-containing protein [Prevotellaceae bacterium]|nr:choice-of-anchor D domain-containing protein [Prevotellaceae bacterium]